MTETGWTKAELITEIETATAEQWADHKRPLLLSELGMDLTKKRGDYRPAIAPLKLRQFIATQLSSKVVVITHPRQAQKIALIPTGEDYSFETTTVGNTISRLPDVGERIKPPIWAAFVKPLAANHNRFIDIGDNALRFQDLPEGVSAQFKDPKIIPPELIIDGKSKDYNAQIVAERIKEWAAENKLSADQLYSREVSSSASKESFFDLFKGLSDSDLRRIEIPFDIIMKLVRQ